MDSKQKFGVWALGIVGALALALLLVPVPAQTAGSGAEVALKCEGKMAGYGELKCLFFIDDVKVTQQHAKATVKQVDPGEHKLTAQAFYKEGESRDARWVKAPTGKKNKTITFKAGDHKDVVFDFGMVKPKK